MIPLLRYYPFLVVIGDPSSFTDLKPGIPFIHDCPGSCKGISFHSPSNDYSRSAGTVVTDVDWTFDDSKFITAVFDHDGIQDRLQFLQSDIGSVEIEIGIHLTDDRPEVHIDVPIIQGIGSFADVPGCDTVGSVVVIICVICREIDIDGQCSVAVGLIRIEIVGIVIVGVYSAAVRPGIDTLISSHVPSLRYGDRKDARLERLEWDRFGLD